MSKIFRFLGDISESFSFGVQIFVYIFVTIIFLEFGMFWGLFSFVLSLIFFIYQKINFLAFAIFFAISFFQFQDKNQINFSAQELSGKFIEVVGEIRNYPKTSSNGGQIGRLKIIEVTNMENIKGIVINVESSDYINRFNYLDKIKCKGVYKNQATMPYFLSQGVSGSLSCNSIIILDNKDDSALIKNLVHWRLGLLQNINSELTSPHKDLFLGMLLGGDDVFSKHLQNDISNTGTAHLIAVSGFNMNLILIITLALTGRFSKWKLIILSDLFLLVYLFFVGLDNIPAKRALIMQIYLTTAWIFGKKANIFYSLILSCLFLFFENIYIYKSLSFQLSFFATLGITMFYKKIKDLINRVIRNRILADWIAISCVANLATMPVLIIVFGKVSLIGIIINILISPLIPITFYIGIAYILFIIIGIKSIIINQIIFYLLDIIIRLVDYFGSQNYAILRLDINPIIVLVFILIFVCIWGISFYREYNHE